MGYINELRQLVGTRPLIMIGAGILLTDDQGRLLLGLRADNGQWGIPGGSMEPGEKLEDTARRETEEETGLFVGKLDLFGVFSGREFFYIYPNGDQVYNVSVVYSSCDYTGSLSASTEHSHFRFFEPREIPDEISPPLRPIIAAWLASQR